LRYWAEGGIRKNDTKLLVARLTNRMQFDLKINRELDRLSEIVKVKSAWRGIKILYRSDPSGDLQMTKFQLFQTFNLNTAASSNRSKRSTASLSSNRLKKQSGDFRNSGIPKGSMLVGSNWSWQFRVRREGQASFSGRSRRKAGGKLDGGVLPLLMSIARTGSTETRRWR
jgi:hypothetical protein